MENTTTKPKLTNFHVNTYALAVGLNTMAFQVPTLYLTMFMTDYLGISGVAIGTGMLIAKTADFIVSLIAGVVIEKTNMKHGKYLSWIRLLTFTLFFGNIVQMLDTTSFVSSPTLRLVIVCIFYMMFHCSMNFYATSRAALIPKLAGADMEARKKLTARQAQVGAAVAIISSAITLPCIELVDRLTGSPSMGYFLVALAFSLCFAVVNMIFVKSAKAFDPPDDPTAHKKKKTATIAQMFSSVVTNKQMLVLFVCFTLFSIGTQINAGVQTHFFTVTGTFSSLTIALTARSICAFLASLVGPAIGRKFGKKGALVCGWLLYMAGLLVIWLFALTPEGEANLVAMTIGMCMCQSARYLYTVFMANYWLDCGEYGYYKTGIDNRTMAVTVMNWPTKIGFALGGSAVGFGIAWAGYVAPTSTTAAYFTNMSRYMMVLGLIPAICMLLAAVLVIFLYKLTDKEAAQYAKANVERESGKAE